MWVQLKTPASRTLLEATARRTGLGILLEILLVRPSIRRQLTPKKAPHEDQLNELLLSKLITDTPGPIEVFSRFVL
jgi:hypothetical protein